MEAPAHVLLIEDNPGDAQLIRQYLRGADRERFALYHAERLKAGLEHLDKESVDVVLLDLSLPDSQGWETFERLQAQAGDVPVVILTGLQDEELALRAAGGGAQDYLVKGEIDGAGLLRTLNYAIERAQLLRRQHKLNRALNVLSAVNQTVVRAVDEQALLDDVCRILTNSGGYRFAWVGFADADEAKRVRPVARAGDATAYLDEIIVTWADDEHGHGPTGTAVRTGRVCVVQEIQSDPCFDPWRETVVKHGLFASVALPLSDNGHAFGALNIYAAEPNAFDEEEVRLLTELAKDLAYGIGALRTNIALHQSEERFAKAFHTSPIAVTLTSLEDQRIIDVNDSALNLFDYSREEVLGRTSAELGVWSDTNWRRRVVTALRQGDKVRDLELKMQTRSGERRQVLASFEQIELEDTLCILTLIHDITERKAAEEELREREEQYRLLADNTLDVIWTLSPELEFTYVNPAVSQLTGHAPQEWIGTHLSEHFNPESFAEMLRLLQQELAQGLEHDGVILEIEIKRKDGSSIPVEVHGKLIFDEAGRLVKIQGTTRDISERKQAEAELRRSEERYRLLFETMAQGVVFQDADGRVIAANRAATQILGLSEDEIMGRTSLDPRWRTVSADGTALPGERHPAMVALRTGREVRDVRLGVFHPQEGKHRWLNVNAAPQFRPGEEEPYRVYTTFEDITARERYERELEAIATLSGALRDRQTRAEILPLVLKHARDVFGAESAAIALHDEATDEIVMERVAGQWPEMAGVRMAPGEGVTGEVIASGRPFVTADLAEHPRFLRPGILGDVYAAVCTPLNAEGRTVGALWLVRTTSFDDDDLRLLNTIAERAASALHRVILYERVQAQAAQMQRLIDTVADGLVQLDADYQIVLANPAGTEYLEILAGEVAVGERLTHLGDLAVQRLVSSPDGNGIAHEIVVAEPQHRLFEVDVHALAEPVAGGGWVLVLRDLTEERRAQERIQQQERLASVGQLAAGIAHDFNNIMAVIMLYSETLEKNPDFESRLHYLRTINEQARHAANLIGQILDFSRRSIMEPGQLDLGPFVKETVKLLKRTLPETIDLKIRTGSGQYLVNADPTRLQQVLMNLAVNARDAMPRGGVLQIALTRLSVTSQEIPPLPGISSGDWVCLSMTDTGCGIPPEDLPHVFEPFFTSKGPDEGTGLGLAQVYGIVKQHEGEIEVTSELGMGTTFTIYLPVMAISSPNVGEAEALSPAGGAGQVVLLVEDNGTARAAISDVLEMLGYQVLEAGNGTEALRLFSKHADEIALVVTDMVMPGMDGAHLHAELKRVQSDVKVVVMTGYPLEEAGKELLSQGIVAWIQKPFDIEKLTAVIQEALA